MRCLKKDSIFPYINKNQYANLFLKNICKTKAVDIVQIYFVKSGSTMLICAVFMPLNFYCKAKLSKYMPFCY